MKVIILSILLVLSFAVVEDIVNQSDYFVTVENFEGTVVVQFTNKDCSKCKDNDDLLDRLSNRETANLKIIRVDED